MTGYDPELCSDLDSLTIALSEMTSLRTESRDAV